MTQDEQDLAVAQNIYSREVEWFHYDLNVRHYQSLLSQDPLKSLPAEWPAEISKYKSLSRDEAVRMISDSAVLVQVTQLQHRDRLQALMKADAIERDKVEMYRNGLASTLPQARLNAAMAKAKAARDAAPPQA